MKKAVIVLVGYNSPCFPTHVASATMSINGIGYEYKEFPFSGFINLDSNKPGRMLNWLKKNAKSVQKLNEEV